MKAFWVQGKQHVLICLLVGVSVCLFACGDKKNKGAQEAHSHHAHTHGDGEGLHDAVMSEENDRKAEEHIQKNIENTRNLKVSDNFSISNAWVREIIPGQSITAAYFDITNESDGKQMIVEASSSAAGEVTLHETIVKRGEMRMLPLKRLFLLPKQSWSFKPGGLHLMLKDVKKALKPGEVIVVKFVTAEGEELEHAFEVRSGSENSHQGHSH